MVKKTQTIVSTSQPVPVQEIKQEELEKVKLVETVKAAEPKKKKTTKATKVVEPVVVVTTPAPVAPVAPVAAEAELDLTEVDENAEVVEEVVAEVKDKKRNRRVVNKESFYNDFEAFVEQFNGFLETIKIEKGTKNSKTLMGKKLKQLQNDSYKLLKIKYLRDENKPKTENNSGFMKPIKISNDLASFLETNAEEPITRVHVTKKLCQYIKEKDLQNPADRREIVPDLKLKALFNMLPDEKLTYYSMQKQIQQHIFKI
jgi:chromatin remodeling complex protein RSC6